MRLIDVSQTIEAGMVTYKGLPAPVICDYLSREASRRMFAAGTEFQIGRIDMVANTGTYLDSPFHRYSNGKDLSELPLASLANLSCVVARIEPRTLRAIRCRSKRRTFAARRFSSTRHGIGIGAPISTSRGFRISPRIWLDGLKVRASRWSGSIRTTLIAPTRASGRCIQLC